MCALGTDAAASAFMLPIVCFPFLTPAMRIVANLFPDAGMRQVAALLAASDLGLSFLSAMQGSSASSSVEAAGERLLAYMRFRARRLQEQGTCTCETHHMAAKAWSVRA